VSEPEPVGIVDLGAITAQAVEVLRTHIAAQAVRVEVQQPLPTIPGQATKLRHVVSNLIGNAIRFVPPGVGVVGVSARREGRSVVLAVRDNGVGIPAEYHQAIFELFRRVPDGDGAEAGSGMGLAIVKQIVETHGGEVGGVGAGGGERVLGAPAGGGALQRHAGGASSRLAACPGCHRLLGQLLCDLGRHGPSRALRIAPDRRDQLWRPAERNGLLRCSAPLEESGRPGSNRRRPAWEAARGEPKQDGGRSMKAAAFPGLVCP
jgi:anti-sigma regulatory factor (Ser/Thr protein kinase)